MSSKESDERLEAFNAIVSRLASFGKEEQRHILASVVSWLGISGETLRAGSAARSETDESPDFHKTVSPLRFSSVPSVTAKEFLLEKAPQTNVERIACLAYYLTHYRDTPHFRTLEISKLNTEAALPKFSNASYSVRDATTAGVLVNGPRGAKQLSAMGEQFVLSLPDRDQAKDVLQRMRPRKRKVSQARKNSKRQV